MVQLFSDVKDKAVTAPRWDEHPFKYENLRTCAYICPIKDVRNLNLVFPSPDLQEYYKSAVSSYAIKFLGSTVSISCSKVCCICTRFYS